MTLRCVAAALLLVLVGCGSDGDASDAGTPEADATSDTDTGDDAASTDGSDAPVLSTAGPVAAAGYNDCVAIAVAHGQLDGMLAGGSTTNLPKVLTELSTRLPAGLQDELAVVSAGVAAAGDAKLLGAPSTETPDFTASFERMSEYVDSECAASDA